MWVVMGGGLSVTCFSGGGKGFLTRWAFTVAYPVYCGHTRINALCTDFLFSLYCYGTLSESTRQTLTAFFPGSVENHLSPFVCLSVRFP